MPGRETNLERKLRELGLAGPSASPARGGGGGGDRAAAPRPPKPPRERLTFRLYFPRAPHGGAEYRAAKSGPHFNFTGLVLGHAGGTVQRVQRASGAKVEVHDARGNLAGRHPRPGDASLHALVVADARGKLDAAVAALLEVLAPLNTAHLPVEVVPGGEATLEAVPVPGWAERAAGAAAGGKPAAARAPPPAKPAKPASPWAKPRRVQVAPSPPSDGGASSEDAATPLSRAVAGGGGGGGGGGGDGLAATPASTSLTASGSSSAASCATGEFSIWGGGLGGLAAVAAAAGPSPVPFPASPLGAPAARAPAPAPAPQGLALPPGYLPHYPPPPPAAAQPFQQQPRAPPPAVAVAYAPHPEPPPVYQHRGATVWHSGA